MMMLCHRWSELDFRSEVILKFIHNFFWKSSRRVLPRVNDLEEKDVFVCVHA